MIDSPDSMIFDCLCYASVSNPVVDGLGMISVDCDSSNSRCCCHKPGLSSSKSYQCDRLWPNSAVTITMIEAASLFVPPYTDGSASIRAESIQRSLGIETSRPIWSNPGVQQDERLDPYCINKFTRAPFCNESPSFLLPVS